MRLSIIIVNFNVKYFLEQCLCSVVKAVENIESEIIVVDNNSTDGSQDFFKARFAEVTFIWNKENTGFSKANNLALKQATGEYILFLNPDTILPEDCLEKCMAFFERQNNAGATGIRMIDGSGKFLKESKRGFPSSFTSLCKLSGLTAIFPNSRIFARYYLGHLDQYKNHEVDVLAGAFMLIPKKVLEITGSFDERFFMYGEDIDLSYRIQKSGFKNFYFSESTIVHFKGESTNKGSLNYIRLFYGAMGLFVKKHYSSSAAGFYNLLIRVVIPVKALLAGLDRQLNKLSSHKKIVAPQPCLIVAEKKEAAFILSLLQTNSIPLEIIGRVDTHMLAEEDVLGELQQLPALVTKYRVKEIIFCMNGFSPKEMIVLIQLLPAGINFRFHFEGTFSIIH